MTGVELVPDGGTQIETTPSMKILLLFAAALTASARMESTSVTEQLPSRERAVTAEDACLVLADSGWEKYVDGRKVCFKVEPASNHSLELYEWKTTVTQVYEDGKWKSRASTGWSLSRTIAPGSQVELDVKGKVRMVVPGKNFVCASDIAGGFSACWGTKLGEPAQVWLTVQHK